MFLLAAGWLRADASLDHARQAQALLGPETWSQVIRVENDAAHSRYPRTFHALVFEFDGLLWFYTDVDGTQSFSLHRHRLAEEKADFAPLLRDIEPGFVRWHEVPVAAPASAAVVEPPNACFIESIAALRTLWSGGERPVNPQLLSYYVEAPGGRVGHTVLAYERRGELVVIDPSQPGAVFTFPRRLGRDALALAREFDGPLVANARLLALDAAAPATPGRTLVAAR